ncbi:hypothetical protein GBF38_007731 [Nibea albiflora]|uniref:Uncharacterized protein n=1 Tax=Nibea albiflora TaxID=240163 RepID=A0ACB7EPI0_NIBAL|nr:hypothetical protein GBF38_007731 [Nibea albiflora]
MLCSAPGVSALIDYNGSDQQRLTRRSRNAPLTSPVLGPNITALRTQEAGGAFDECQARIKPTNDDECHQKTLFFSKDAGVKAVLTGKRQTRKLQNKQGQCGRSIKATVASGAQGQITWPSWPS